MAGTEQGPGGVPAHLGITGDPRMLGQNVAPAAPGAPGPVTVPGANALNNQYLLPQNLKPAEPGTPTSQEAITFGGCGINIKTASSGAAC
jgi:hypothetical protein